MSFNWLKQFHCETKKTDHYAEKTLKAYALGIKAGGSIRGVRIQVGEDCCQAARGLPPDAVYQPEDAPRLPLEACPLGQACRCVYRPVMAYEPAGKQDGEAE